MSAWNERSFLGQRCKVRCFGIRLAILGSIIVGIGDSVSFENVKCTTTAPKAMVRDG